MTFPLFAPEVKIGLLPFPRGAPHFVHMYHVSFGQPPYFIAVPKLGLLATNGIFFRQVLKSICLVFWICTASVLQIFSAPGIYEAKAKALEWRQKWSKSPLNEMGALLNYMGWSSGNAVGLSDSAV